MLTYQIRRRLFRRSSSEEFAFPNSCVVRFHFRPEQPFGASAEGGRTAKLRSAARMLFDTNTGRHWITSADPLQPVDVRISAPNREVHFRGNVLEVRETLDSLNRVDEFIASIYHTIPPLLNLSFADPPYVTAVEGEIGSVPFRWELQDWQASFEVTTEERQEEAIVTAWDRILQLSGLDNNRRILAALHYFYIAVRLDRVSVTPGEFMAEAILNLAKTLEVLFPPSGDGRTRDSVRSGLATLGYSSEEIERSFVPAIALRNEIDVGHVSLALFKRRHLTIIHRYTEEAEQAFRDLLNRVLRAIRDGGFNPPPYREAPSPSALEVIRRLEDHFAQQENRAR